MKSLAQQLSFFLSNKENISSSNQSFIWLKQIFCSVSFLIYAYYLCPRLIILFMITLIRKWLPIILVSYPECFQLDTHAYMYRQIHTRHLTAPKVPGEEITYETNTVSPLHRNTQVVNFWRLWTCVHMSNHVS